MRISDWSSDVCSSDLETRAPSGAWAPRAGRGTMRAAGTGQSQRPPDRMRVLIPRPLRGQRAAAERAPMNWLNEVLNNDPDPAESQEWIESLKAVIDHRSEEHTSELQSLMRISYAVLRLKKK